MHSEETFAALAMWQWRDAQLTNIAEQLEDAFPALEAQIRAMVAATSWRQAAVSFGMQKPLTTLIDHWAAEQTQLAMTRAEAALEETIAEIEETIDLGSELQHTLASTAPFLIGGGLLALTLPAIGMAATFGVQTSTVLFFFSTSTVSFPILAAGAVGVGILGASGATVLTRYSDQAWTLLERRCLEAAFERVFGKTGGPQDKSILNAIQLLVLKAGENRLKDTRE